MAYSNTGLHCLIPGAGEAPAIWIYRSEDAAASIDGAGFFSDAGDFGIKVGDVVLAINVTDHAALTGAAQVSLHVVTTVSSGAATVSGATTQVVSV